MTTNVDQQRRVSELRHHLFRHAMRDHRELNAIVTEDDAGQLLLRAVNTADDRLVQAVLQLAIERRYEDVTNAYVHHYRHDERGPAAHELWQLTT